MLDCCIIHVHLCLFQINEYLDQFVIGQPRCKKVLATQVYIHYKRIRHNFPEQPKTAEPFSGDLSLKTHEFHQQLKGKMRLMLQVPRKVNRPTGYFVKPSINIIHVH